MSLKAGDRLNLKIEKIVHKGLGLSRHQEIVVFVPFVCENEEVEVLVTEVKKNYAHAEAVKIVTENQEQRSIPICPVYGTCGGCDFQHLNYKSQISIKKRIIEQFLKKLKIELPEIDVFQASNEFFYRNRIQLKANGNKLGYYKHKTHQLVPIEKCYIASDIINNKIEEFKRSFKKNTSETVNIKLSENTELIAVQSEDDQLAFSQVNNEMNLKLKQEVQNLFKNCFKETKSFIELYCGSGNFTFDIAQNAEDLKEFKLVAVELDSKLLTQLKNSCAQLGLQKKIQTYNMKVEHFFKRVSLKENYNILLDPPRTGAGPLVMEEIARLNIHKLVYVSCEPSTLVRDLIYLNTIKKFRLTSIKLFDMFPQTHHIETVVALSFDS